MNTASLTAHYRMLTAWERVPLILAAAARGDELEEGRLIHSAARQVFLCPDHSPLFQGLYALADIYMIRQLALAALYWQGGRLVDRADFALADNPQAEEVGTCLQLLAYRFGVLAAAWKELCAELQIDPEQLPRDMPGYDTVCHLEKIAQLGAWTADEAAARARSLFEADRAKTGERWSVEHPYRSDSIAEEVRAMREFLEVRARSSL